MRRRLTRAIVATACAASVGVGAQAPAPTASPGQAAPRRFVVIGCLSRETAPARAGGGSTASRFILTDPRGDKPTAYRLDGDEATLALHVGHTIEAAGPLSLPPPGDTGPHADALIMKVSALTYISRTCK
jgi:hypothetical protein